MTRAVPTGLRRRLIILVLASVLPFLLLIGLVARTHWVSQRPLAAERASGDARRVAARLDALLRSVETTARALTHSVSANPLESAKNDRVLRAVAASLPDYRTSWTVVARDGALIGSSSPTALGPGVEYAKSLAKSASSRPAGSIMRPVNLPGEGHSIHMVFPIRDSIGNGAVLVAQIPLRTFRPLMSAPDLPRGTSIAVVTDRGIIVGRSPDPERWVGYDLGGTPLDSAATAALNGPVEFTTPDSVRRLLVTTRMSEAPWRVGIGIPTSVLFSQARTDFSRALGYGGLALALALALALWQASRIIEPIKRLSADAARLGTGDLAHRSDVVGGDEFGVLASTMNEMATTLEHQGVGLRESEARYRRMFDINPLAMWVLDAESLEFLAVNRAATEVYGYSESEFLAMKASDMKLQEERADLVRRVHESGEETRKYLTRHKRKDGTFIDVEIDAGPISFDDRPARLVVAQDVSERTRAEEALRAAELQLRKSQRLEAIGQLTGGIAHDFNNVLTAIGSYSDFLYDSLDVGDARRLDVQEIRKAADRAADLTKQLLAFSRSQILQPVVLNVNDSLAELELLLKRLLTADLQLVFALDPEVGNVHADPGQLAQVVMNLAVNARDAMPSGGVLTIASRNEHVPVPAADAVDSPSIRPGDYVVIEVSDTGVGMDGDTVQRIFEPFFTTKGPGKGTGLGLSTAYGIVEQSGGYIFCDSEPGKGTTFTIRLPRVDHAVEPGRSQAPERAVAGQRSEVVLVVEDEESVRRAARRILVKKGYTVLEACDGNDAVELLNAQPKVDLLLTDLVMPGMGGRELVRVLQAQGRAIPTLYMSGYTKDAVMRSELDPDIMVLEKPFSQDELASKVRQVLDETGHS